MDKNNPIGDLMQESMAKLRELADTNSLIGRDLHSFPTRRSSDLHTPDGVTLIPISRVSMGMGGGGAVFGKKQPDNPDSSLGSGLGMGVHIDPVAFLVVKDGFTRVIPVAAPPMNTVDRVIEMAPDVIDKVTGFIEKQQDKKKAAEEAEADIGAEVELPAEGR